MVAFNRICTLIATVVRYYTMTLAAILIAIVVMTVFTRTAFTWVFSWSEEVPRYLLIWITFMAGALCVDRKDHIALDLFPKALPPRGRDVLETAINLMLFGFGLFLVIYGIEYVRQFGSDTLESIPWLTNHLYYPALPICGALIMLFAVRDALNIWLTPELRTRPESLEELLDQRMPELNVPDHGAEGTGR